MGRFVFRYLRQSINKTKSNCAQLTMDAQFCYNSPIEAPELFIPFLSIPSNASDMKLRTINDLVSSFGGTNLELGPFGLEIIFALKHAPFDASKLPLSDL